AAAVLVLCPALVSAGVAVTGSPPLRLAVTGVRRDGAHAVARLTLRVTNSGTSKLTPHYMLTTSQGMSRFWSVVRGPATVPAHGTVTVAVRPPDGRFDLPTRAGTRVRLRVFTPAPQTLTSTYLRLDASDPSATG
ncbi:hypothetical protein GA0115242_106310, partial [Streptomyces sp. SolWspMP-5a-2]